MAFFAVKRVSLQAQNSKKRPLLSMRKLRSLSFINQGVTV